MDVLIQFAILVVLKVSGKRELSPHKSLDMMSEGETNESTFYMKGKQACDDLYHKWLSHSPQSRSSPRPPGRELPYLPECGL